MTDTNQKKLGNTLWKIADENRKDISGFQPYEYGPIRFPGALPQAGMVLGRWPVHSRSAKDAAIIQSRP